ncbi:hypothetical protein VTN00DRAFT_9818 [Thermoascus crustaceus]|uniref:uncharacterized protein n=1 Tax=Thermoascus crustaceus TaxID=5088 RepID=UPI0037449A8F
MDGIPPPSAAAGAFDSFLHPGQEVFSNYRIAQPVETPAAPHPPSGSAPPPARRKPVPEDAYPVGLQEGLPEYNSSADRPRSREPPSSTRAAAPTPAVEYLPSLDEALPFEFSDLDSLASPSKDILEAGLLLVVRFP